MQELALLLPLPEHQTDVPTRLLGELSACHSESEAIEVLFIFWLAFNQGWAPRPDLGAAVLRKSMLTDRLLAYVGLAAAPTDFHAPIDFDRRQGRGCAGLISTDTSIGGIHLDGNMTKKQRRTFDAEFKLQVVQMI